MRSELSTSYMPLNNGVPASTRVRLGHLRFTTASQSAMATRILQWLAQPGRGGKSIAYVNPHVFNLSVQHVHVQQWLEGCDLVCVDGIGIKLAMYCLGRGQVQRVVAEELFRDVLLRPGRSVAALLVGVSSAEVEKASVAINRGEFAIKVVDSIDGFSTDDQYTSFFNRNAGIGLILLGAGTPRSELIGGIARHCCSDAVCWHIGAGTIKTWAGSKRRAPAWVSRAGIQWLHRIIFEPHTRSRYANGLLNFGLNLLKSTKAG